MRNTTIIGAPAILLAVCTLVRTGDLLITGFVTVGFYAVGMTFLQLLDWASYDVE